MEDAPLLLHALKASKADLLPWMVWAKDLPGTLKEKKQQIALFREQFQKGEDYSFAIIDKVNGAFIGSSGLHTRLGKDAREIGYWINSPHVGNGFAVETSKGLVKAGFELHDVSRIEIHCDPANLRSQNIPRKLGFILKENNLGKKQPEPDQIWRMGRKDYLGSTLMETTLHAFDGKGLLVPI